MRRLALIAPLVLAAAADARGPGFWLPGLPPGSSGSVINGVSADGLLAAGAAGGKKVSGFTWTAAGGRIDFGLEEGMPPFTPARGVNSDGSVVVGYTGFPDPFEPPYIKDQRAYRRVGNGLLENLGLLPEETRSRALGVSGDGQTVVGTSEHGEFSDAVGQAFRWTPQTGMQGLGFLKPGGTHSKAYGISRDGMTVVGASQSGGPSGDTEAFTWTQANGMQKLPELAGSPPSGWCEAFAADADGSVVVGRSVAAVGYAHPTRWVNGQIEDLYPGLDGMSAFAYAVDASGDVVGGSTNGTTAFVWTAGTGLIDLENYLASYGVGVPADYRLESVNVISGDGLTFAGQARDLITNKQAGFVATIPTPGTLAVIVAPWLVRRRRG